MAIENVLKHPYIHFTNDYSYHLRVRIIWYAKGTEQEWGEQRTCDFRS